VSAFHISQYEITRAQYLAIIGTDPSETASSSGMNDPVQHLTWYDAVEFCNKLSIKEGLTAVYTISGRTPATGYPITEATVTVSDWNANGYRLPTEMEWMWAAMGATSDSRTGDIVGGVNTGGYTKGYAGSTETLDAQANIDTYAWHDEIVNDSKSRPVGGLQPNELDLYDMSGNILEWTWDRYVSTGHPTGILTNYRGGKNGMMRVVRGGTWYYSPSQCAVNYSYGMNPQYEWAFMTGFRVVRP
jgi:formylglycine-generating enzyme required for sulfatase activity